MKAGDGEHRQGNHGGGDRDGGSDEEAKGDTSVNGDKLMSLPFLLPFPVSVPFFSSVFRLNLKDTRSEAPLGRNATNARGSQALRRSTLAHCLLRAHLACVYVPSNILAHLPPVPLTHSSFPSPPSSPFLCAPRPSPPPTTQPRSRHVAR